MATEPSPERNAAGDGPDLVPEVPQTVAHVPIGIRSVALTVLAGLAIVFTLRFAWEVLIPVVLGILISYALDPIVLWLARRKVPRFAGAALVLLSLVSAVAYGAYTLSDDALAIVEQLPEAAQKLKVSLRSGRRGEGVFEKVQQAAEEIEDTAAAAAGPSKAPKGVQRVQIVEKPLDMGSYIWWGGMGVVGLASQGLMLLFLVYFLLVSGDLFRRKLVKVVGDTLSEKRVTVQILDEITMQIERFMFVQLFTSCVVALVSSLAFKWVGLEQAILWGILAGLFNTIPYVGPVIVMGGIALVAFLQFGTLKEAAAVAGLSFVITSLEGFLLTPYLLGRASRMNGVAVFVGLLFWGWVWGVFGMLLAVPILVVIKSICDRVESLRPIGEMLGE